MEASYKVMNRTHPQSRGLARNVAYRYRFANTFAAPIELWLALPPTLASQQIDACQLEPAPQQVSHDAQGINSLAYYRLAPNEVVTMQVSATLRGMPRLRQPHHALSETNAMPQLTETERAFFLRSTRLIKVTDGVRDEAQRICGAVQSDLERARMLYWHLVKNYRYQWPPPARGSEYMRRNRRGDCGEYSYLYAAWCRALGIPCRVLVGAFAHGSMSAHVWNEVFLESLGWIAVDASIHQPTFRLPVLSELDWALLGTRHNFGLKANDRVVFSVDPEVPLVPPFQAQPKPDHIAHEIFGDDSIAWGYESLDGTAPHLQPAYVRIPSSLPPIQKSRAQNWLPGMPLRAITQFLGQWHFQDSWAYRLGSWIMVVGFGIGVLGTLLSLSGNNQFDLLKAAGYFMSNIVFIRRTGLHWWKMFLGFLFGIDLVVASMKLFGG
jgi:hypothetical protein